MKNPMMKNAPGDSTIRPFGVYQPPSLARGSSCTPMSDPAPKSSRMTGVPARITA